MTQSVELLLDEASEAEVRAAWVRLADAGLPSEERAVPSPTHRPHVTLWAGSSVASDVEMALPALVAGLDLPVRIGALLAFGPRRGQVVLARQVVVSPELLQLQIRVAELCGVELDSHFAAGRWTPHLTLARRVPVERLGLVVGALGETPDVDGVSRTCRRWDGDAKTAWDIA